MSIYSPDVLLSQFGTSLLFHVQFSLLLPDLHTDPQKAGQVVWYPHLFKNFQQFVVIHTVKSFGVVNKADFFGNSLAFLMIQQMLAIWSLVSLPFLNPTWASGSSYFTYSSNCCFLTCILISQEAGQVVWYSHLLKNFPHFFFLWSTQSKALA